MINKWETSQRAVEAALLRGSKTVAQLMDETGYSRNTVKSALRRCDAQKEGWPPTYNFITTQAQAEVSKIIALDGEAKVFHLVKPVEIDIEEVGPRWQSGAEKIGREIAGIDLQALDLKTALKHLEVEAASILGVIVALRSVKDGPDWRTQIGLLP